MVLSAQIAQLATSLLALIADYDGSASTRGVPTVIGSWPSWWHLGEECAFDSDWNTWLCDWYPWRTVGRLDIRVPGYTSQVRVSSVRNLRASVCVDENGAVGEWMSGRKWPPGPATDP